MTTPRELSTLSTARAWLARMTEGSQQREAEVNAGDNLCIHAAVAVPARQRRGSVAITGIRAERLPRDPQSKASRTPHADTSTSR